jgi:hypothetical protein
MVDLPSRILEDMTVPLLQTPMAQAARFRGCTREEVLLAAIFGKPRHMYARRRSTVVWAPYRLGIRLHQLPRGRSSPRNHLSHTLRADQGQPLSPVLSSLRGRRQARR